MVDLHVGEDAAASLIAGVACVENRVIKRNRGFQVLPRMKEMSYPLLRMSDGEVGEQQ